MSETKDSVTLVIPEGMKQHARSIWSAMAADERGDGRHWVANQIEAQIPPAVEEPTEFGSMVRAGSPWSDRVLWVRSVNYWFSETYRRASFSELTDVEVLRVGVGELESEPLAEWETELLQQQDRREVAAAVLAAMDVDQYLIDAVTNARPR